MEDLCTIFEFENRREKSIDENWTLFKKTLLKSMEKNIPTKKITVLILGCYFDLTFSV
jgi:hypothetical protein